MTDESPPIEQQQQPVSPRRRLQVLLAIPDSQRTEAQWDEINELEISLAPGNRTDGPVPSVLLGGHSSGHKPKSAGGGGGGGGTGGGGGGGRPRPAPAAGKSKKPFHKGHKKPAKPPVAG